MSTPPPLSGQVLLERVYRLGQQPELLLVEIVTAAIGVLSIVGPPPPSLHAAVGTAGVRLWGAAVTGVAGMFFAVVHRERRHPPRRVLLELVALILHIVLWAGYIGFVTAVHYSGYTSSLAIGCVAGVMLVRVTEIVQDIRQPRYDVPAALAVPDPGGGTYPGRADLP